MKLKVGLLLLAFTAIGAYSHAGGDAVGYNGPDTEGKSIPIKLDRAITIYQIVEAQRTCYGEILIAILKLIYKDPGPFNINPLTSDEKARLVEDALMFPRDRNIVLLSIKSKYGVDSMAFTNINGSYVPPNGNEVYTGGGDIGLRGTLPLLAYVLKKPSYDEWGRNIDNGGQVTNLHIVENDLTPYWKRGNNNPTQLKIDHDAIVKCLLHEIQK
ncbi:MAG: hypothetical protein ACOYOK_09180 [Pseudobdellovibrionaceae bacterium]